jgi:hypothetical protein
MRELAGDEQLTKCATRERKKIATEKGKHAKRDQEWIWRESKISSISILRFINMSAPAPY